MNYDSSSVEVNLITAPTDSFGGELVTVVQANNTQSSAVTSTVVEGSSASVDILPASTVEATVINGGLGDPGPEGYTPRKNIDYFDGREVAFRLSATHIQWHFIGEDTWTDLLLLADIKGDTGYTPQKDIDYFDGLSVELQKTTTHIQWRLIGGSWANLVALTELKGADGYTPIKGVDYFDGTVVSLVAGTGITIDNTDPAHPVVESVAVGGVSSVNSQGGDVVLDPDDLDDTATTHKFISAAQLANIHAPGSDDQDLSGKVDKITGKGLSTNDYTTTEKNKLGAMASPSVAGNYMRDTGSAWESATFPNLANQTFDELMAGTVNGVNKVFTTASNFAAILVFKNGVTLHVGDDYTITGANQITMVTAPAMGTKITCLYNTGATTMINGSNSWKTDEVPSGLVNSSNGTFTTSVPYIANSLELFINGVKQLRGTHFTETTPGSGIFTMSDAPLTGDNVIVNYQFVSSVSGNADTLDGEHLTSILQAIYPVGSTFTSGSIAMPALIASIGIWVRLKGRVIVGLDEAQAEFDVVDEVGGHKSTQLHKHDKGTLQVYANAGAAQNTATNLDDFAGSGGPIYGTHAQVGGMEGDTGNYGAGDSQNLQPYKVKYMWERTA